MADQPRRVIAAACDGACRGNPGPGGWGALLRFEDGSMRELGGADPATTNNRMELCAALALMEELRTLPRHPDLVIRTDSRYLIDGLQKWLPGWKRKGWRTASGSPVLNRDLWEQLETRRLPDVPLVHVRGHSGDADNDRCDAIAVAFSRGQRPSLAAADSGPVSAGRSGGSGSADTAATAGRTTPGAPAVSGHGQGRLPLNSSDQAGSDGPGDPAPVALRQLLSRLELADRLAQGGYALSLPELAQLVELPLRVLEQRREAWSWRDWQVLPHGAGRWRLERDAAAAPDDHRS